MRVLILGGTGMTGHKLVQVFRDRFETWTTVRTSIDEAAPAGLFDPARTIGGVDAARFDSVVRAFDASRPDVVVNGIGVVKQLPGAKDPILSLTLNALFPHHLAALCRTAGVRLVHISTDCVFSGRTGRYTEDDVSDAEDLYGRTKYLGEVQGTGCLTLRTSIIGRELRTTSGLVEWFLARRGTRVSGYRRAVFSGFTTLALARLIGDIIERHPDLNGVYHASTDPITKYDLLCLLDRAFATGTAIEPDDAVSIDRSLDSSRLRAATGLKPPPWPALVDELARDGARYEEWRRPHVL